jgi:hypothetical protein
MVANPLLAHGPQPTFAAALDPDHRRQQRDRRRAEALTSMASA